MKSNFTQDDVDAGDRDEHCGKWEAAEDEVPRTGLGPTHRGESFRSGIGVGVGAHLEPPHRVLKLIRYSQYPTYLT